MARDWESTFSSWTGPASDSEEERYERTKKRIERALRNDQRLAHRDFRVYPKGSYPNYTNVVADSDVDIAVELQEIYGVSIEGESKEAGLTLEDLGGTPYQGDYSLAQFKDEIESVLRSEFGSDVERGDKAIHIAKSSTQLAADVVPCRTHKTWMSRHRNPFVGIELRSDKRPSAEIVNYPAQHLEEGKAKNRNTLQRYKSTVRILKRLENEMVKNNAIEVVPSFMIESAVFCVPNSAFLNTNSWKSRVGEALAHIYKGTTDASCVQNDSWLEANSIKYLFHPNQPWSHRDINSFAYEAWNYAEFS